MTAELPLRRMGPVGVRAGALAILAGAAAIALWVALEAYGGGTVAVPAMARVGVTAAAFFAFCGYGPARLLLPAALRPRLALYALPVGAAFATLAMTVLGLLRVPFDVSLAVILLAAAASAVLAVRRVPSVPAGDRVASLAVPLAIAVLLSAVACLPALLADLPVVQGQNPDAMLVSGTANLLQHAPPTADRPDLPLDSVPPLWRSKLPIYYALAAVARLSGQETMFAFSPLIGATLGLTALGFFLLVLDGFGAPLLAALAAMLAVGLDRIVIHLPYFPLYNQLWALGWLPVTLLFGWRFLREPSRNAAILAGAFLAVALFTYPLLLPFPAVFLGVIAWQRRRENDWRQALRLPSSPRLRLALIAALAIIAVPVTLVLLRGIVEKLIPAAHALLPGQDLRGWGGNGIIPYYPFGWFFGISMAPVVTGVLVALVFAAALLGLRRIPRDGAVALAVLLGGALLGGLYLLGRGGGELFHFRDLAMAGPLIVSLAVVGAASLPRRGVAVAVLAAFVVVAADGTRDAVQATGYQTPADLLAVRAWDREIPADQTIRIDVERSAYQLWSWYLLQRHRVSALDPLAGPFPHPPQGVKADLALTYNATKPPLGAVGAPIRRAGRFALYRLRPDLPGADVSTRAVVFDTRITY